MFSEEIKIHCDLPSVLNHDLKPLNLPKLNLSILIDTEEKKVTMGTFTVKYDEVGNKLIWQRTVGKIGDEKIMINKISLDPISREIINYTYEEKFDGGFFSFEDRKPQDTERVLNPDPEKLIFIYTGTCKEANPLF